MDITIYEDIVNSIIDYIKRNELLMVDIDNNKFKSLVLDRVENYSNNLDIYECKKIIKSYGSFFEVLRIYADDEDIHELFNNNENNFYKELSRYVIFKRWFDESHKLVNAYEYIAEIIIDNQINESETEPEADENLSDNDKSETELEDE